MSAGWRGDWTMAEFRAAKIAEIRAQVGNGQGDLRAVGRRRFVGRGGADPRGDRRPAHLRLRRPRPDARGREPSRSSACSATTTTSRWSMSNAETLFLNGLAGVTDPEAKRKFIGKTFIDVFEDEAQQDRRRRFPGAGHALSRRDRERQLHRRALGDDQEPPQCRRPARAHEHEARRAAARTVQGRGPRARPRAGPARGVRRPPPVPRPGPRDPHPRRGDARSAATSCARPTRSISRKSATPGSTTRSGRRSRCCCRCARSA